MQLLLMDPALLDAAVAMKGCSLYCLGAEGLYKRVGNHLS